MIVHPIPAVYNTDSRILILGSFPSVKSREAEFFYAHPQNRFWKVLSVVFEDNLPSTTDEKKEFLIRHKIALWDVIGSCDIKGSQDASIKNVIPNDIGYILKNSKIEKIFANGKSAFNLYNKYIRQKVLAEAEYLPSTSPANAVFSLNTLIKEWAKIRI